MKPIRLDRLGLRPERFLYGFERHRGEFNATAFVVRNLFYGEGDRL